MAYSKTSNKTQDKDVKYLSKDYNGFKNQLIEFAKIYFPNNFNDFSEGNPGMMFLEMAAYVGDVLSFYTDTQLRESFLSLAQEKENLNSRINQQINFYIPEISLIESKVNFIEDEHKLYINISYRSNLDGSNDAIQLNFN